MAAMQGTIGPDLATVAVAFRRNQPQVPALQILDACLKLRTGRVADFGDDALATDAAFALLVCEAFGCSAAEQQAAIRMLAHRYGLES